jgi:NADH-quinone oxidoreductase subunit N
MLAAVIAAFLYLRIIVAMYMGDEEAPTEPKVAISAGATLALTLCLIVTIGVGVYPGLVSGWAEDAIPTLVASTP